MSHTMERVVIVGAGPGGLAAAVLLASRGVRVTVLERLPRVGGRTSTFELEGGYRFDLGPTFFLYPRVLDELLASCGRSIRDEVELVRLDPQYRLVFGAGGSLDATPDRTRMEEALRRLSPVDAPAFARFMEENRDKLARMRPCLEQPFTGWRDVFTMRLAKLLPVLRPWRSLEAELAKTFQDPRLRVAFSFQSKYLGMSPARCPSLFSILSFLEYEHGVWHPIGGCGAVTEALARIAREMGVEIRLDEPVTGFDWEGRRPRAALTAQGRYEADAVVVNADFARAMRRLVPDALRATWSDRKIENARFSCSTFMLYLGIEGSYPELEHHTIYVARDYARNLDEIEKKGVLSDDPSFYVQNASRTDPTLAPPGHSTLYVLVPVTHDRTRVDWNRERDRFRAHVLGKLAQVGITDVEKRIRAERIVTPLEWDQGYEIHRGATFNLAHDLGQMLHLRPRNRFDDLERTYLVGGGTHPGSGLPVIFESARISTRLLLEDLGVPDAAPTAVPAASPVEVAS